MWCRIPGCLLTLLSAALAGPFGPRSLKTLTAQADAIIVGSASATYFHDTVDATIQVERVLKGSLSAGDTVSFLWAVPGRPPIPPTQPVTLKGHGLFFLTANTVGSWALLPAAGGDILWEMAYIATPVSVPPGLRENASGGLSSAASALDRVYAEVITNEEVSAGGFVPTDIAREFADSPESRVLATAFTRFAASQDPRLKVLGLRGNVRIGDPGLILQIRQSAATVVSQPGWGELLHDLMVYYRNTSLQAIRNLGEVATDPTCPREVRTAAAVALASMHTQASLPYLASLLDDPDVALRAMGVGGLSSFADNVPIGSHTPAAGPWKYRTDDTIAHSAFDVSAVKQRDSYFVGFWRNWWQQYRSELVQ